MKVSRVVPPPIPSNFSDEEVLKHVRHYFPNLSGQLETLVQRFEALLDRNDELAQKSASLELFEEDPSVVCPECGTRLELDVKGESE